MKSIALFLLLAITTTLSAQQVTRNDLNNVLLKSDVSSIEKDGFTYQGSHDGLEVYTRYDSTEVIVFNDQGVTYMALHELHNYRGNVRMTPKGDLLYKRQEKNYKAYIQEDESGNLIDTWNEYTMPNSVLQVRMVKHQGEDFVEATLIKK